MSRDLVKAILQEFQAQQLAWCDDYHKGNVKNHPRGSNITSFVDRIMDSFVTKQESNHIRTDSDDFCVDYSELESFERQ